MRMYSILPFLLAGRDCTHPCADRRRMQRTFVDLTRLLDRIGVDFTASIDDDCGLVCALGGMVRLMLVSYDLDGTTDDETE